MSWTLPDLIDIANLQMLMDRFHTATGIPVGIISCDGEILVATGWQEICTKFHRNHPVTAERCRQSDDYIKTSLSGEDYVQYKCRNGLWDLAVPIVIAGEHCATLFLGQFFYDDEEIDEAFFLAQSLEFNFDPDRYMAALRRVPVFSREKVRRTMGFYTHFVDFLVSMGQTAQRQIELGKSLRESEERYRALFESASDAIFTIRDGCIVNCNRKALEIFNCRADEFISMRPEHLSPAIQPDGIDSTSKALEKLAATLDGRPQFFEWRHSRYDGTIFDAEVSLNRLEYQGNTEVLAIIRDITVRKRAEEALQLSHDELEKRVIERTEGLAKSIRILKKEIRERRRIELSLMAETAEKLQAMENLREKDQLFMQQSRQAAMGEMIGNIAHQWRQPLNTLGLNIQQLQVFHETGEFSKEYLDSSVCKSMALIQHMSQTIDDFRNFFRPEKEKVDFHVLNEINKTLSLIEAGFKNQHISIEVDTTGDLIIHGYSNEFSQVLLNILINARDAFSVQTVKDPRVTISLRPEAGKAVVTITDNAGGIPENIMDKIFDPYFTTKGPDKGTGVGLFMSKSIIEKSMGGILSVRNTGDGAEFRIEI